MHINEFKKVDKFGTLSYFNCYSFYFEPIIFSAKNEFGQLFFCYNLGISDDDRYEQWIINPISESFLNNFEQKKISIKEAIIPRDRETIFKIHEDLENNEISLLEISKKKIGFILPKNNIFISENVNLDGSRKYSHKIRVYKSSDRPIASDILNRASDLFISFCRNFLDSFSIPFKMYSEDAVPGSFIFRILVDEIENVSASSGFEKLSDVSDHAKFVNHLDERDIDQRKLKELLDTLIKHGLSIDFIDENSTNTLFSITDNYAKGLIPEITHRLSSYLDSTMVPQADSLDSLRTYLEILYENGIVTADLFNKDKRQVSYYRDACELLNLVHNYGVISPLGIKAITSDSPTAFIQIVKEQFENTECGTIWMSQQDVTDILNIDESTAAAFLIESCRNLSENTAKRRAVTLRSWVKNFRTILSKP